VEKLELALRFAPDNPRIRRELGMAYAGLGNTAKASEHLRKSAKLAPDNLKVQVLLGRISAAQKQYDRALVALRTAAKCSAFKPEDPWAADALLALGGTLDKMGYWQAALECYTKLSEWINAHGRQYLTRQQLKELVLRPQWLLSERGRLLLLLRRPEEAADLLQQAFRHDRTHRQTVALLTDALTATKRFAAAEELLVELSDEPSQRRHLPPLARKLCLAAGDKEMPARIWQAYRKKKSDRIDTALATALARTAEKLSGSEQASAILEPVMAKMPSSVAVGSLLARLYVGQGKSDQALGVLASLLSADPESAAALDEAVGDIAAGLGRGAAERVARLAETDESARRYAMHYLAAVLARREGKGQLAAEQLQKAIAARKDFLPAHELCVDLLLAQRKFDEAEQASRRLRKIDPDHYLAYYLQGKIRLARREVRPAIDSLLQAKSQNPDHVPTRLLLTWAYERAGDQRAAEKTLREAVGELPLNGELCRRMFDRYIRFDRRQLAHAVVRKLRMQQPDSIIGRAMEAEFYLLNGKPEGAKRILADLRSEAVDDVGAKLLEMRIESHPSQGLPYKRQHVAWVRRLRDIADRQPGSVTAGRLLSRLLTQEESKAEAAKVMERLHRNVSENLQVEKQYLWAALLAGQHATALAGAEALLREDPKGIYQRGLVLDSLAGMKRFEEAIDRCRQWLGAAGDEDIIFWHRLKLLGLYEQAGRYEKAQDFLDNWMAADPARRMRLLENKLRLYALSKDYDGAIRCIRRWPEGSPDLARARVGLAQVLLKAKAYDKLESALREWIGEKRDESVEAYRALLIGFLVEVGRTKDAQEYASAWIGQDPYSPAPRAGLLQALAGAKKHKLALELADSWIKELSAVGAETRPEGYDATLGVCRSSGVRLLMDQDKYKEALKRAERYLRKTPKDPELLQLRSVCFAQLGKTKEAISDLEAAFKLDSEDIMLNNNLGYMLADAGIKLEEAERMIRSAVSRLPGATSIQDSLGWVLYKRGQIRRAGGVFRGMIHQAGEEGFTDAVIYDHAGDAFYRLGWIDRAKGAWQQAVDLVKKKKSHTPEDRRILSDAPKKLRAVKAGRPPNVAPLGRGMQVERPQ
jgi:tetratricopeptide (TPR) repeat protein